MDVKTRSIVIGAVALVILLGVAGAIVYLGKSSRNESETTLEPSNTLSDLPVIQSTPSADLSTSGITDNNVVLATSKIYQGQGFNLQYPKEWGILTCNNSENIEFDPNGSGDARNVSCDYALKPVTVIVASTLNCTGETVNIGAHQVVKSKAADPNGDINYRWCLNVAGKGLDITHRVSTAEARATSKDDFSAQIEKVIESLRLGGAS